MTDRTGRTTRPLATAAAATLLVTLAAAPATAHGRDHRDDDRRGDRGHARALSWEDRPTGTTERFRGLAPVDRKVAWVSGTTGTVLRTEDGGRTWTDVSPGTVDGFDTSTLQFRDIEAWDDKRAVILSIGTGEESRIYRTSDGGRTWRTAFVNQEPTAFYDCMGFWNRRHGLALSDPVDGKFRLQRTTDGGRTWSTVDPSGMVPALEGEFAFAASGTCLITEFGRYAWIGTGGAEQARVLRSSDRGETWTAVDSGMRPGPTAGVYSLAFRTPWHGVAVGGAFDAPEDGSDAAAWSRDSGRSWTLADEEVGGYRSGSAWLASGHKDDDRKGRHHGRDARGWRGDHDRHDRSPGVLAVGPTGSDVSWDGGRRWTTFDTSSLDSVECTESGSCWASGEQGRVARLERSRR
jgi:photosystem II stability/assembly factor-like uncharacterized protein